jgi:hypothetical protein
MEKSVLAKPPNRLDLHIFGLVKSSAEGWQGIGATVIIVIAVAVIVWWR